MTTLGSIIPHQTQTALWEMANRALPVVPMRPVRLENDGEPAEPVYELPNVWV